MCESRVYIYGECECCTYRILLCSEAEKDNYKPCKNPTPPGKPFDHLEPRCSYHQSLLGNLNQQNESKTKEESDKNIGFIREYFEGKMWYFSTEEKGARRITVDSKGVERTFPPENPPEPKKIRVLFVPPPPPPPPTL